LFAGVENDQNQEDQMKRITTKAFCIVGILLCLNANGFAAKDISGDEAKNISNEGLDENVRYHGEITKKSGPEIIISGNELNPTPSTVFYDENRGLISESDFVTGEKVIYSYHPTTMELIYIQKEDKTIPLQRKNGTSEDKQKEQDSMNKNPVKLTNGVYTN
jgi:hypothetical protein